MRQSNNMLVRHSAAALCLTALTALTGCGGGGVGAGDVLVVAQVEITPPGVSLQAGSTHQLQATPKTSSGIAVPNRPVTWSSDDQGIATISTSGLLTGVGTGSTRVNATVDGVKGSVTVEITPKPVVTVTVVPSQVPLMVGETADLIATPRDENSQPLVGRAVSFSSDNPLIATVSGDGHVVAVSPGLTVVRATVEGKVGTANIAVSSRPAAQLDFQNEPTTAAAGAPLPAIRIEVQNDQGGAVTSGDMPVTIALGDNPTGAVLGGTKTVNAFNGVAVFGDLTVNQAGTGYTLVATSGSLKPATSAPFAVVAGIPTALGIAIQPSATGASGTPLARQPVIQLRDAAGNAVAKAGIQVTAALEGGAATLGGTRTVATNAEGVATFTNLTLTGPSGTYTLLFAAPNLTAVASNGITLGAATALVFTTEPPAVATSGAVLSPAPVLRLVDGSGSPVDPDPEIAITASLSTGPGTLSGATSVMTVNGTVSFPNLILTGPSGTYGISFSGPGLTPAHSGAITIGGGGGGGGGGPTAIAIVTQPSATAQSGIAFTTQPVVQLLDASNNAAAVSGIAISAAILNGGGTLGGTATQITNAAGQAIFTDLSITGTPGPRTLRFTGTGLSGATSSIIEVTASAVPTLQVTTQPASSAVSGVAFTQQPVLLRKDANGAGVPGATVTAKIGSGPAGASLTGATAMTDAAGVATFSGLAITGQAGTYSLTFESDGLSAVSGAITLIRVPTRLVLATAPSTTPASGIAFTTQPAVQLADADGSVAQQGTVVTAVIASGPSGASLAGSSATTDATGLATFSGLTLSGTVGTYTLRFESGTLAPVSSGSLTLGPGAPASLEITTEPPASADNDAQFRNDIIVQVRDANGNNVPGVSIAVGVASGQGFVKGTLTRTTGSNGRANFNDLELVGLVGPYTLAFTAGQLSVVSRTITLEPGREEVLAIRAEPPASVKSGQNFSVQVELRDSGGNLVLEGGVRVNASLVVQEGTGDLDGDGSRDTNSSGVATFSDLRINGSGKFQIRFSSSGMTGVTSVTITVTK